MQSRELGVCTDNLLDMVLQSRVLEWGCAKGVPSPRRAVGDAGLPAPPKPPAAVDQMKLSCGIGGKVPAWVKPGDGQEEETASSHGAG